MGWIADLVGVEQVDRVADAWRWWAAMGSFVGIILLRRRFVKLAYAWFVGNLHKEERTILSPTGRLVTTFCAILFMAAAFIAGMIIPLANDNRVMGFTRETFEYRSMIAFVWLLWGSAAWGIAISLAPRARLIVAASVVLWWAAYIGSNKMVGAML